MRIVGTLVMLCLLGSASLATAAAPRFATDVMPALSKAGCNMGACHGNANGKGGLKLSLRGEDPQFDYDALVRQHEGRRVNVLDPAASLLLQKPSGATAHQGGVRFSKSSWQYEVIRDWLAAGARGPQADDPRLASLTVTPERVVRFASGERIPLRVTAVFVDGATKDVTAEACYETSNLNVAVDAAGEIRFRAWGEATVLVRYLDQQAAVTVTYARPQPEIVWRAPEQRNYVDEHIFAKLESLHVLPSDVAPDNVFVRRAYLDALGILPTADEAKAYVADARADKQIRLIDQLMQRPEFAEHWALKWSDVLRNEEKVLDPKGVEVYYHWIKHSIASGKPMDQFVRELVSAHGSTFENPPANYYRANRDPETRGETTARLFLGVRLQCARCHNHPFDRWTQDDYYAWSANFARIDYEIGENKRRDKLDKNEFKGDQKVLFTDKGEVKNPRTGKPATPKFLGAATSVSADKNQRLEPLAQWLTSANNELFVNSQVNFVWYHLMGRGLVEPIDDVRPTNPPTHPELMDALSRDFVESGFDLRHLVRVIMTSQTYALSSEPNATNHDDTLNYSRAIIKRLPAEKLLDAQCQVLGVPPKFENDEDVRRAGQLPGPRSPGRREKLSADDRFLRTFGKPDRLLACECERSNETTLAQALTLVSGEALQDRLASERSHLAEWAKSDRPASEIIEALYWHALQRSPTAEELSVGTQLLSGDEAARFAALQDLAWAVLNAKEFVFRR